MDSVLKERAKTHGSYKENACYVQRVKDLNRSTPNWDNLEPHQRETLDMLAHKIARILYGDSNLVDSWADIEGYSKLSTNILRDTDGSIDVVNKKIIRSNGQWYENSK